MRIAYVNQDSGIHPEFRKGAAVHVACVRDALAAQGAEVLAIDSPGNPEVRSALDSAHRAHPLDIVYERYSLDAFTGSDFAHRAGIPHVLEVNSPLAEEAAVYRGLDDRIDRRRERRMFERATRVLAVSSQVARYCVERGARPETVVVRPNAVDPETFVPRGPNDPVRARYVPDGRFAIGYHGRLRPWHNFGMLVDAVASLLERGVDAQLVLLGEGAFLNHVEGRIPPDRCTYVAWLPQAEAARVVASFDVLPLTYSRNASCYFSPLKLLEAMAAGVVPVAPSLGDLPNDVHDGTNGLLYEPDDGVALVEVLERVVWNHGLRARLAAGARAHALTRTWDGYALEILGLARGVGLATRTG